MRPLSLDLLVPRDREPPHGFDDYSPEGLKAANDLRARTLAKVDAAEAAGLTTHSLDETDLVTINAMRERLGTATDLFEAGLQHTVLNVIESPVQQMRGIFDLLPTDTTARWQPLCPTHVTRSLRSLVEVGTSRRMPRRN